MPEFRLTRFFRSWTEFFWNNRKKLSQFGHNVRKGRQVNTTVPASFNIITGQMTNVSAKKNGVQHI